MPARQPLRHEREVVTAALQAGRPLPAEVVERLLLPRMGTDLHRLVAASTATPPPIVGALTLRRSHAVRLAAVANPVCPPLAVGQAALRYPHEDHDRARQHVRRVALRHGACPTPVIEQAIADRGDPNGLVAWAAPNLRFHPVIHKVLERGPDAAWVVCAYNPSLPEPLWDGVRRRVSLPGDLSAMLTLHDVPEGWWAVAWRRPEVAAATLGRAPAGQLDRLLDAVDARDAIRVAGNPAASWDHVWRAALRAGLALADVAHHRSVPVEVLERLAEQVPRLVARHRASPPELLGRLGDRAGFSVRVELAANPATPADLLDTLRRDPLLTSALVANRSVPDGWVHEQVTTAVVRLAGQYRHLRPVRRIAAPDHPRLF